MLPVEDVFYYHEGSKKSKEEAVQESRVFKKLLNDIVLGHMTFPYLNTDKKFSTLYSMNDALE